LVDLFELFMICPDFYYAIFYNSRSHNKVNIVL